MAFVADTEVFTNTGWKKIEKIGGVDRVLVRNFLGDSHFIQPFAVRRKKYDGKVILGGSKYYKFEVTPYHTIVYTNKNDDEVKEDAEHVVTKRENRLKHRSRYSTSEEYTRQIVTIDRKRKYIDTLDWYKLVGYVLRKGLIETDKKRLILSLDKDNPTKDMDLICGTLDSIGLSWSYMEPNTIILGRNSNIARKLAKALGSRRRKDMYIPDSMIFNTTTEYATALIETFLKASRKDGGGVDKTIQFSTSNKRLIDTLEMLGMLAGYTMSNLLVRPAGFKVPKGVTKRDSYVVFVRKSVNDVSIISKQEHEYSGTVYEIDLFEGQIMTRREGFLPLWMNPK